MFQLLGNVGSVLSSAPTRWVIINILHNCPYLVFHLKNGLNSPEWYILSNIIRLFTQFHYLK